MKQVEHPLIADLIANQPKDDRKKLQRRILHSCGHKARVTIWGEYRKEDRFRFASEHKCWVCMMYDSARTCFGYSHKNFGKGKNTGIVTLQAMMNVAEIDQVSA